MALDQALTSPRDYDVPVLRLLAESEDGRLRTADLFRLFGERYSHLILEKHQRRDSRDRTVWQSYVGWSLYELKQCGYAQQAGFGVWIAADVGRQWLNDNPDATRVNRVSRSRAPSRPRTARQTRSATAPPVTIEVLEQTRKLLPAEQFRQLWGPLYDQMLAQERAKAITELSRSELGRRAERWLNEAHAFLRGQ
ncbi:MAG: hypothetical protein GX601_19495, partial [Anaerolineales bacterium]|nr:hypothetical protein [Anaerolineales bacterium]